MATPPVDFEWTHLAKLTFIAKKMDEFGIPADDEAVWNAVQYAHGEGGDYGEERVMGPLAAFVHSMDVMSARIWFDKPVTD